MNRSTTRKTKKSSLSKTRRKNSKSSNGKYKIVTSKGHIFNLSKQKITPDSYSIKIYYGNGIPCIDVLVDKGNPYAILETLTYNTKCSQKEGGLENKTGTKHMVQVSMQYIMDTFPFVEKIGISDNSSFNLPSGEISCITGRYLLQGRKGLYEDYLHAYPIKNTIDVIKTIKDKREQIDQSIKNIIKDDVWTPKNIKEILRGTRINNHNLYFSQWEITRDIVNNYNVNFRVYKDMRGGDIDFDTIENDYSHYMYKLYR